MTKLPTVKPKQLTNALLKMGFSSRPGRGSHIVFFHEDGRYTSIPMHPKPMGKGLLSKILKQLNIPRDQISKYF